MIDAVAFSWAGDKYLGTPYSKMDCQAFVEACMADVGYPRDLGGSNSWYRECIKNGWTGTPEECIVQFGIIPKGALIFIWEPVSESTPEKFKHDGIGDITHMGFKTGRGDGGIHSSYRNKCVCTSKFKDKTIPNGGWNRIGLLKDFDYGKVVNDVMAWYSSGGDSSDRRDDKEGISMNAVVTCPENETVFLRQSWNERSSMYSIWDRIKPGTKVEIIDSHGETWKKIRVNGKIGWMKSQFLTVDDSDIPSEDPDQMDPVIPDQPVEGDVVIKLSADEASTLFVLLGKINEQIVAQIGRG